MKKNQITDPEQIEHLVEARRLEAKKKNEERKKENEKLENHAAAKVNPTAFGSRLSFEKNDVSLETTDVIDALYGNEDGDAGLFIKFFKNQLCCDKSSGDYFIWDGHHWQQDHFGEALAAVREVVDPYKALLSQQVDQKSKLTDSLKARIRGLQSVSRKINILKLSASGQNSLGMDGNNWDSEPRLLGVKNGVIDLKCGELFPGCPIDYIKTFSQTEWKDLDEPAPLWKFFIEQIFGKKRLIVEYVQRLLGYAISGTVKEHLFIICWGEGRNGKTTLFETLAHILGSLVGPVKSEILLWQGRNRSSAGPDPDLMSLRGLRIAWCSEIG